MESAEQGHENGLGLRALLGAVAVGVFSHGDSRAYLAFGVVVVGGDGRVVNEYEQFVLAP